MNTEAASTLAGAAGISLATGAVLGLSVPALAAGFFGGIVALTVMPGITGILARVVSVVTSTVSAAFMSPYVAALGHMNGIEATVEQQAAAFVVGVGAQALLPAAIAAAKRRIDQLGGGATEQSGGGSKP